MGWEALLGVANLIWSNASNCDYTKSHSVGVSYTQKNVFALLILQTLLLSWLCMGKSLFGPVCIASSHYTCVVCQITEGFGHHVSSDVALWLLPTGVKYVSYTFIDENLVSVWRHLNNYPTIHLKQAQNTARETQRVYMYIKWASKSLYEYEWTMFT